MGNLGHFRCNQVWFADIFGIFLCLCLQFFSTSLSGPDFIRFGFEFKNTKTLNNPRGTFKHTHIIHDILQIIFNNSAYNVLHTWPDIMIIPGWISMHQRYLNNIVSRSFLQTIRALLNQIAGKTCLLGVKVQGHPILLHLCSLLPSFLDY